MFSSLLLASLPGLLLASPAPPAVPGSCPGCPADTDVNEEIVNFVYSELSFGDCQKEAIRVENFQSQVVAGIRYKFDLVAAPGSASDGECGVESCHVEVSQLERTHEICTLCYIVLHCVPGLQRAVDGHNRDPLGCHLL